MNRLIEHPQHMFWLRNEKINFYLEAQMTNAIVLLHVYSSFSAYCESTAYETSNAIHKQGYVDKS